MLKITIFCGDITQLAVGAIVNAANYKLIAGGGIDGAIHYAAGPELQMECNTLKGCATGEAKITKGYKLPARYVIHTVGPVYGHENGKEKELLAACYRNSLEVARKHGIKTIAFPAISTGAFRFPKDEAAAIAIDTVQSYGGQHPEDFDEISFVLFSEPDYQMYERILNN